MRRKTIFCLNFNTDIYSRQKVQKKKEKKKEFIITIGLPIQFPDNISTES